MGLDTPTLRRRGQPTRSRSLPCSRNSAIPRTPVLSSHLGDVPAPMRQRPGRDRMGPGRPGPKSAGRIPLGIHRADGGPIRPDLPQLRPEGVYANPFHRDNDDLHEPRDDEPLTFTDIGIIYDSGTPNIEIHPVGENAGDEAEVTAALAEALANGGVFTLTGEPYAGSGDSTILKCPGRTVAGVNEVGVSTQNPASSPACTSIQASTPISERMSSTTCRTALSGSTPYPSRAASHLRRGVALGALHLLRRSSRSRKEEAA